MAKKGRFETIITEKEDRILWITLNRPHRLNSFNLEMIEELSTVIEEAKADDEIKCIIFKGAGDRAFSTGADIIMFTDLDPESAIALSVSGQQLMNKIEASSKPCIAAIHGYCLGGGLELALACDFRIADASSQLGNTEINLGIIPGWGGTQRLSRIVGLAKAKELILIGERINAEESLKIGLVHKVVPTDNLFEEAKTLANKFVEGPSTALKLAKHAINHGTQYPLKEGLDTESKAFGTLVATEDTIEGISAFFEKRKPEFK